MTTPPTLITLEAITYQALQEVLTKDTAGIVMQYSDIATRRRIIRMMRNATKSTAPDHEIDHHVLYCPCAGYMDYQCQLEPEVETIPEPLFYTSNILYITTCGTIRFAKNIENLTIAATDRDQEILYHECVKMAYQIHRQKQMGLLKWVEPDLARRTREYKIFGVDIPPQFWNPQLIQGIIAYM